MRKAFKDKKMVREVRMPMETMFRSMVGSKMVHKNQEEEKLKVVGKELGYFCLFYGKFLEHSFPDCKEFFDLMQVKMNSREIKCYEEVGE